MGKMDTLEAEIDPALLAARPALAVARDPGGEQAASRWPFQAAGRTGALEPAARRQSFDGDDDEE